MYPILRKGLIINDSKIYKKTLRWFKEKSYAFKATSTIPDKEERMPRAIFYNLVFHCEPWRAESEGKIFTRPKVLIGKSFLVHHEDGDAIERVVRIHNKKRVRLYV